MLDNIRKFISDIFHHIRHMCHRTHCESDCGIAACQCEHEVALSISCLRNGLPLPAVV